MKAIKILFVALTLTACGGGKSKGSNTATTLTVGDFFVTNIAGCSEAKDQRAPNRAYLGFYINREKKDYSGQIDQRVYLWLPSCNGLQTEVLREQFVGRRLSLNLKNSGYSANWDNDIANFTSIEQMLAARDSFILAPAPIEFSKAGESFNSLTVRITRVDSETKQMGHVEGLGDRLQRIIVDIAQLQLSFINANGQLAMKQSLNALEAEKILNTLLGATEVCPVEISIDGPSRRVTKVNARCTEIR